MTFDPSNATVAAIEFKHYRLSGGKCLLSSRTLQGPLHFLTNNKALSDIGYLRLLLHQLRLRSIIDVLIEVDLAEYACLHHAHGHILLPLDGLFFLFAHGFVHIHSFSDLHRLVLQVLYLGIHVYVVRVVVEDPTGLLVVEHELQEVAGFPSIFGKRESVSRLHL
jgi:hypothetical protein